MGHFKSDTSHQWRLLKDRLARYGFMLDGISVILAIAPIFFYLIFVVRPLFESPTSETLANDWMLKIAAVTEVGLYYGENRRSILIQLSRF